MFIFTHIFTFFVISYSLLHLRFLLGLFSCLSNSACIPFSVSANNDLSVLVGLAWLYFAFILEEYCSSVWNSRLLIMFFQHYEDTVLLSSGLYSFCGEVSSLSYCCSYEWDRSSLPILKFMWDRTNIFITYGSVLVISFPFVLWSIDPVFCYAW